MRLGKRCWYPRAMPVNEKPPARLVDNYLFALFFLNGKIILENSGDKYEIKFDGHSLCNVICPRYCPI